MGEAITGWVLALSPAHKSVLMWCGVAVIVVTDLALMTVAVLHAHADWMRARVQSAEWKAKRDSHA